MKLAQDQQAELIHALKTRFENNMQRHAAVVWADVEAKLQAHPEKLLPLREMENTGGEPDVVGYDKGRGEYIFYDCAAESPKERRSLCFDKEAREGRAKFPPKSSALEMAAEMGIEILTEAEYRELQELGEFDLKTSSWVATPAEVRELGGALFCDRRFGRVFTYHNGADSYYGARGFRGSLRV